MPDDKESKGEIERIIDRLAEGGIPEILAGPAGKAISRLIGGAADIPAAQLEQWAQAIRNRTASAKTISESVATAAAQIAATDAAYTAVAIERALGKIERRETNVTSVAVLALEHIGSEPDSDGTGPSDDWLNFFESVAEKASSSALRDLLARVLAGEIRKNGSFSLRTISVFSTLTQKEAENIQYMARFMISGSMMVVDDIYKSAPYFERIMDLEEMSLISLNKTSRYKDNKDQNLTLDLDRNHRIILRNISNGNPQVDVHFLTRVGIEVFSLVDAEIDQEYLEIVRKKFGQAFGAEAEIIKIK